jgi:hypothetical protein
MKYLKNLKRFLEDYEITDTDSVDITSQKQDLNLVIKQISDYNTKKIQIDDIFLKNDNKTDDDLKKMLDKVVGTDDNRNPFLSEYTSVAKYKRQITKLEERIVGDKIKVDDFNKDANGALPDIKTSITAKVKEINDRIALANIEIGRLEKEMKDKEADIKKTMDMRRKDMEEKIKNLTNT